MEEAGVKTYAAASHQGAALASLGCHHVIHIYIQSMIVTINFHHLCIKAAANDD